jgi:hypothetical protein
VSRVTAGRLAHGDATDDDDDDGDDDKQQQAYKKISNHNQRTLTNMFIKRPLNNHIHKSVLVVTGNFLDLCA